jgi:hypothetical protein
VEYLHVTPSNSLYFPAVDFIRSSVGKAAVKQGSSQLPVIVDCRFVLGADFTAAKVCFLSHIFMWGPWKAPLVKKCPTIRGT